MKNHTAAIFDMDGVIIDSGPFHLEAWQQILEQHGIPYDASRFRSLFGMRDSEVAPHLIGVMSDEAIAGLMDEKSLLFQRLVRERARPIPGIAEFVRKLNDRGVALGLASLARPEEILVVLDTVGLRDALPTIITREHSMRDKPAPDIFLTAAYRLGVSPSDSVVFEDAVSGIEAARSAGATTVAISTSYSPGELSHADLVVSDFTNPQLLDFF